ncbi:MAG: chromosome segregation SMC family protein [Patescibacteria group bacterium]
MYLEKLTIQGFKSFASKNSLIFPGMLGGGKRGITAIVGPNGSGKSNIADAVRWALGEQSMKTLRGKKSQDIIFSGSDRKGGLGMSEVSLHLNNKNKKALIDYSQIILTRRLFRNGESEYLINNNRVRLADIQMLLAKASFGQRTYSVIGQGMVEGFLNTSLAERKEFFDEATGIKQFQMKRDESLNKLQISYENLSQVNMLLVEIEPRLRSLTRQINKLKKRDEIESKLKRLQLEYYGKNWHQINNKFNNFNSSFLELEKIKFGKEKKLKQLQNELNKIEEQSKPGDSFINLQKQVDQLQRQKDVIIQELAKVEAREIIGIESRGESNLSWMLNKKEELVERINSIDEEIEGLNNNIGHERDKSVKLNIEKKKVYYMVDELNNKLQNSTSIKNNKEAEEICGRLKKILEELKDVEKLEEKEGVREIKRVIQQVKKITQNVLQLSESMSEKEEIEEIHQNLIKFTQEKEKIMVKISENNLRISAWSERVKLLASEQNKIKIDLENLEEKINGQKIKSNESNSGKKKQSLKKQLEEVDNHINKLKSKMSVLSREQEDRRSRLFSSQKSFQFLQNEINEIIIKINEIKINSTRYETKLEDLEVEIRRDLGNLKGVKEYKIEVRINEEIDQEELDNLKRQLSLIGGIDIEVEKEYTETKNRYDFLSNQVNDLSKAIHSLERIIKELDLTIREKFDKEFKVISIKFEEYFKVLFNGGSAKIVKIMEGDSELEEDGEEAVNKGENIKVNSTSDNVNKNNVILKKIRFLKKHNATGLAGIEIQATPPGKKIRSISMLSGGERALTAIALICAIISANPSPFVVLDEVDAALDEANSERLSKILDNLSHKTQFIIITHNRATMRRANILYGVTMKEDGVSRLLSIKLEEAKKVK